MKKITFLFFIVLFSISISAQQIKGNYAIKNVKTGLLLRPENASRKDGASIVLYSPTNWKCMTWKFHNVGDDTYQFENLFTGKTFSVLSLREGCKLIQSPIKLGDSKQHWIFKPVSKGIYKIQMNNTNLYLTPTDQAGEENSPVILLPEQKGNIQLWTIYEQDPSI